MRIAETISRRSIASGWRRAMSQDRPLLDLALERVEAGIGGDDAPARGPRRGARAPSTASASIFSAMPPISAMRAAQVFEVVRRRTMTI